jgi:hypothetical protein
MLYLPSRAGVESNTLPICQGTAVQSENHSDRQLRVDFRRINRYRCPAGFNLRLLSPVFGRPTRQVALPTSPDRRNIGKRSVNDHLAISPCKPRTMQHLSGSS